jgi:hypothetical protein
MVLQQQELHAVFQRKRFHISGFVLCLKRRAEKEQEQKNGFHVIK